MQYSLKNFAQMFTIYIIIYVIESIYHIHWTRSAHAHVITYQNTNIASVMYHEQSSQVHTCKFHPVLEQPLQTSRSNELAQQQLTVVLIFLREVLSSESVCSYILQLCIVILCETMEYHIFVLLGMVATLYISPVRGLSYAPDVIPELIVDFINGVRSTVVPPASDMNKIVSQVSSVKSIYSVL